jgi:hypothetical protein
MENASSMRWVPPERIGALKEPVRSDRGSGAIVSQVRRGALGASQHSAWPGGDHTVCDHSNRFSNSAGVQGGKPAWQSAMGVLYTLGTCACRPNDGVRQKQSN